MRSMLLLIGNLRQQSMRERHISVIVEEVGEHFEERPKIFDL